MITSRTAPRAHPVIDKGLWLEKRLEKLLDTWPKGLNRDLVEYLSRGAEQTTKRVSFRSDEPYWIWLPRALMSAYAPAGFRSAGRGREGFLRDVIWGQYCAFLSVRIQDDLFDGQARHSRLLFGAGLLLLRSQEAFSRHFALHRVFWDRYRSLLRESTFGILEADALQTRPAGRRLLPVYARVSAVFKLGTAAVCLKLHRPENLGNLFRFADELAIVGQIVDDLMDVEEDLERGRWNFAASVLLGRKKAAPSITRDVYERIWERIFCGDGATRILNEAREHVDIAGAIRSRLRLQGAEERLQRMYESIDALERAVHETGVESFFSRFR